MNDREPDDRDHWEMMVESMDLTIEGHRLIANEIAYETKALWRGLVNKANDLMSLLARRRSSPPV
jgi:hypothetical protein